MSSDYPVLTGPVDHNGHECWAELVCSEPSHAVNTRAHKEVHVETINLTPDYEATSEWFARALAEHNFERGSYSAVVSLIEQVLYLQATEPDALERVLKRLRFIADTEVSK